MVQKNWDISLIGIANCTRKCSKCIEQKFIDYLKPSMNERSAYRRIHDSKEYAKMYLSKE